MPDVDREGPCAICANNPDRDHKPGEPWKPSPPECETCRDSLNPLLRPSNWRPLPQPEPEKRNAESENTQLRIALRAAVKALCEELCAFGGSELDADGLPICSRPCPELKLAYELLRPATNEPAEVTRTCPAQSPSVSQARTP